MPDFIIFCMEMTVEDFAVLYSLAQRRGKDIRTYLRDLIREDATKVVSSPLQEEKVKRGD